MSKINFAVIGYGGMGSYHAHNLIPAESSRFHVVGTYDISGERQQISKGKGLHIYGSLEEVLTDNNIEAVLIATPNDSHKEIAIRSMRAGKHVVCEKPVAMNTEELDDILAVAEETGKVFMVHQNRRWDPDFLIIRQLYQNRTIGEIFQIESRVQGANGIPGDWRHLKKHGGGMLLDWGVHLLDQLLWLVDSPVQSVFSDLSYILGDEVDDGFMCYITFENGVKALVEVGTTNYTKLPRWYVKGLEGTAKINDWDLSGEIIAATGREDVAAPTPIQAGVGLTKTMAPPSEEATEKLAFPEPKADFVPFYQNFYEVVREGAEPIVKNQEVRKVMKLMDDILQSCHKG
ncbi:Gfo/Idh/MocA family oxidoreductase [Paenibacillus phoenicis]|uniref:Gfo/Idh/MocA family oxidoreductase n=1 Tax=Paenibacillus phoenicis TaxID=554117 RepID=A0ABU5PIK7_9BACL|nr:MULTISPECIES: Gfo/Idh/MocA family oxidoreductase [Paenibacillus]MCT2196840.1 Gfo/Idh/MocA family oxidoreductase [Paenibacillus sp. p3-SID1389]MEA3569716.1 Gfo/Idh/MocA family oxidoreductase [Paenibacillus phoenicis]